MKPSEVRLEESIPPLTATFEKTEHEVLAALIVIACRFKGDVWQPVTYALLQEVMESVPVNSYELTVINLAFRLRLVQPDYSLAKHPEWFTATEVTERDGKPDRGLSLTEVAIARLPRKAVSP